MNYPEQVTPYELHAVCNDPEECFVRLVACQSDEEAIRRARELLAQRDAPEVEVRCLGRALYKVTRDEA